MATAVTSWAVFTRALLTSSGVRMAGVSQGTGPVMVTMTVEISVTKPKQTAPGKVRVYYFFFFLSCF